MFMRISRLFFIIFFFSIASVFAQCTFCTKQVIDYQKYYEDDLVVALYCFRPMYPGHCLILPKRHIERFEELTSDEMLAVQKTICLTHKAVKNLFQASSYLLLQKNGKEVGQSQPHLHFHYIPRRADQTSTIGFLWKFFLQVFRKDNISKEHMNEMTYAMSEEIKKSQKLKQLSFLFKKSSS